MSVETPKKTCNLTEKKANENSNQYCRCCKCSLRVKYGDKWKSLSSENVYHNRKRIGYSEGKVICQILDDLGIVLQRSVNQAM
jgi:hypothetical protein